jgi:hypothetical protein
MVSGEGSYRVVMASEKLIDARIAESEAQRAYDRTAVVTSALMTMLAVAVPVIGGVFALLNTRLSQISQLMEADARSLDDRAFLAIGECLSPDRSSEIRDFYCNFIDSSSELAKESREIARAGEGFVQYGIVAALLLVIMAVVAAWALYRRLVAAADRLGEAQGERIRLEVEQESARHSALVRRQRRRWFGYHKR